jgi:DNA-binding transcriptional MerR regulator
MSHAATPLFADGKSPDAMRTIGEVAAALGIRQHVLRYWEQQFPMLRPLKRSGGRRLYRPEDVALLVAIDRLVNREAYTIKGARAVLGAGDSQPDVMTATADASSDQMADLRARLQSIRARLSGALQAA